MSTQMATGPVPEEMGKPLEDSLNHLVDNSRSEAGSGADQLARKFSRLDTELCNHISYGEWNVKLISSHEQLVRRETTLFTRMGMSIHGNGCPNSSRVRRL